MTTDQYISKLQGKIKELEKQNKPFEIAVRSTMALQSNRIFIEGKNSSGSSLGQYDTTLPMYINPLKAPRATGKKIKGIEGLMPPTGKNGDTVFKNGEPHKTTYVKNYKDYRNRIGRRVDRVDITLSGDLQSDFRNSVSTTKVTPTKVNTNEYITVIRRPLNTKKIEGLEKKYGVFTNLTTQEREAFYKVNEFELRKFMAS